MKILRIHKGFTTNSSSSADWVPSTPKTPETNQNNQAAQTPTQPETLAPNSTSPEPSSNNLFFGNSLILGGLVGALALIFFLEKAFKKIFFQKKNQSDED